MSVDAALLRHLGPTLTHATAASNLPLIRQRGLLPAATLAAEAGTDIVLRAYRRQIDVDGGRVTLNHQNPINHGIDAARRMLDGYDPAGWAAQLDTRVFLSRGDARFARSIAADTDMVLIEVDTAALIAHCADRTYLSPINSGNFRQGGANARRGDWLYVPVSAGLAAFRANRRERGLVTTGDTVREVSVIGPIPHQCLRL